jgi:hypothetical protein
MRNVIIILILYLIICNIIYCEYSSDVSLENIEVEKMEDYVCKECDKIEINSIKDILEYLSNNIQYKDEKNDYWQLPEETITKGTGDCEDFCILFMYLLKNKLEIENSLTLIKPNKKTVHTVVYYSNQYSDPTMYNGFMNIYVPDSHILWKSSYEEVMWMTYNYHDNIGKYR